MEILLLKSALTFSDSSPTGYFLGLCRRGVIGFVENIPIFQKEGKMR